MVNKTLSVYVMSKNISLNKRKFSHYSIFNFRWHWKLTGISCAEAPSSVQHLCSLLALAPLRMSVLSIILYYICSTCQCMYLCEVFYDLHVQTVVHFRIKDVAFNCVMSGRKFQINVK
jgi:hypothetical protein